jgi:chromosome segregation ATPase
MVLRLVWKLQRALEKRNAWLLLREQRIIHLEQEIEERDDLLSAREQRIRQLETQIKQAQEVVLDRENGVREREQTIALLEAQLHELKITDPDGELHIEIDRRGALLRQREARIRTLEIELRGREAELYLFRTALDKPRTSYVSGMPSLYFWSDSRTGRRSLNTDPGAAPIG